MATKKRVQQRVKEPSTWAGLAGLAVTVAQSIPATAPYATAIGGIAAIVAMFLPERAQ